MFHITCKLPNASESINGIEFARLVDGEPVFVNGQEIVVVQTVEPVDEETAAVFRTIPGYVVEDAEAVEAREVGSTAPAVVKRGRGRPRKDAAPTPEQVVEAAPAAVEPVAEPAPEPVAEPVVEPTAEPVAEAAAEPTEASAEHAL